MEGMIDIKGKDERELRRVTKELVIRLWPLMATSCPGRRVPTRTAQGVARRGQDMAHRQLGTLIRGALTWVREHDRLAIARADNIRGMRLICE